jgi:hypothetical protein
MLQQFQCEMQFKPGSVASGTLQTLDRVVQLRVLLHFLNSEFAFMHELGIRLMCIPVVHAMREY